MSLFEKILIIVVSAVCTWAILFAVSLLINNSMWWLNALITFVMVGITVANMTTWRGSEYDPDMMP